MNQASVTVFWTLTIVILILAVIIPVSSDGRSNVVKDPKLREANQAKAGAGGGAAAGQKSSGTTAIPAVKSNTTKPHSSQNCTHRDNSTGECIPVFTKDSTWYHNFIGNNKGMLERTMYVLVGVTVLVVLYFVIKAVRLRRKRSKTRKYGVISTPGHDNMEMTPLDQDEDDEDMTVFELNGHAKK